MKLAPQPHGGALNVGGRPKGAKSRASIREALRRAAATQYDELHEERAALTPDQRAKLADIGFKYGLGTQSQALTPQAVEEQVKVLYDELVGLLTEHGHTEGSAWAFVRELIKRAKIAYARMEGVEDGTAAPAVRQQVRATLEAPALDAGED